MEERTIKELAIQFGWNVAARLQADKAVDHRRLVFWAGFLTAQQQNLDHIPEGFGLLVGQSSLQLFCPAGVTIGIPWLKSAKIVRKPLLLKALGANKGQQIFDATCGLGVDSFYLSTKGHKILAAERNPLIYALLWEALCHYQQQMCQRDFYCIFADSQRLLSHFPQRWPSIDTILLDPMFAKTATRALPKVEMQQLRGMCVPEDSLLLTAAARVARDRIIVKRPRKGSYLQQVEPQYSLSERKGNVRYDVYLVKELQRVMLSGKD